MVNLLQNPLELILSALAAIIALTVHEYCHGYAAYKLGDDTAKNFGRLTLNPLKHLDPYGAICLIFFRIGWAKPVPINSRNFKNPRRDCAITAAAGPVANLLLGFISAFLYLLIYTLVKDIPFESKDFVFNLLDNTLLFLYIFHLINIGLGIFNLLPIPPFDGSRILYVFLPPKIYFGVMKYERYIYLGVLGWLLLGKYVAMAVRSIPLIATNEALYTLAGVFSLSEMISTVINWISLIMFKLISILPFIELPLSLELAFRLTFERIFS